MCDLIVSVPDHCLSFYFRRKRSCEDHVYSACTLIRNRLISKKETFGVFIDFQKAFDFVNRNVLLYKLLSNGINGKFYNSSLFCQIHQHV